MLPRTRFWIKIAVLAIALVIALVVLETVVLPSLAQPKITMTNMSYASSGCTSGTPPHWTYTFTFDLVNTGNANGFALVQLYLNGAPSIGTYRSVTFLVPQGSGVTEQPSIQAADCGTYSPGATVTSVTKA